MLQKGQPSPVPQSRMSKAEALWHLSSLWSFIATLSPEMLSIFAALPFNFGILLDGNASTNQSEYLGVEPAKITAGHSSLAQLQHRDPCHKPAPTHLRRLGFVAAAPSSYPLDSWLLPLPVHMGLCVWCHD